MTELDERLTRAFADLFAERSYRFIDGVVAGGPGYYGVRAAALTPSASEVEVIVTFRPGVRYCCFEAVCHAEYHDEGWWARLRECMVRHGLGHLPLPTVRAFCGVIECGAVMQPGMVGAPETCFVMEGLRYQTGPWEPICSKPTEPETAPDSPA